MLAGLLALCLAQPLSGAALVEALSGGGSSNDRPVVDYNLEARYDPSTHRVEGRGTIRYTNRSAGPISELWWHLYLNAFRNQASSFMLESGGGVLRGDRFEAGTWGFIELSRLEAEPLEAGLPNADLLVAARFEHPDDDNLEDRTVLRTPLPFAVLPGQTLTLAVGFTSQLPQVFARSGYSGSFAMVAQWFPKIGVLEAQGWNCHQYHATSEFYADYGRYQVAITVPEDQVLGATGVRLETKSADAGWRTEVYAQDRIHDFAFAVDPRFRERIVDFRGAEAGAEADTASVAAQLGLAPEQLALSDVKIRLLYQPEHEAFADRYLAAMRYGLGWLGRRYGAYPYSTLTVIDGPPGAGGAMGMEYPTLIAAGVRWPAPTRGSSPEQVAIHELAHQWWYGLVGSNEFEEAWLDEGLTTYSSGLALDQGYGPFVYAPWWLHPFLSSWRLRQQDLWRLGTMLAPDRDAIVRPSWAFRDSTSYGMNVYPRPALTLAALSQEIGPEVLARSLRLYQQRWRYRHPHTADFQQAVEDVSGRSLAEFFDTFLRAPGALDYAVTELQSVPLRTAPGLYFEEEAPAAGTLPTRLVTPETKTSTTGYRNAVYVERLRDLAWPVTVELCYADGRTERRPWDGRYRWARFESESKVPLESARLEPGGHSRLDLSRVNDSRTARADPRVGAALGSLAHFLAQSVWQLLGVGW